MRSLPIKNLQKVEKEHEYNFTSFPVQCEKILTKSVNFTLQNLFEFFHERPFGQKDLVIQYLYNVNDFSLSYIDYSSSTLNKNDSLFLNLMEKTFFEWV